MSVNNMALTMQFSYFLWISDTELPAYLNWYTYEAYDKMLFLWAHGMLNDFRERLGLTPMATYDMRRQYLAL